MLRLELLTDATEFIHLPFKIYENNPYWVPPLISEEKKLINSYWNPFIKDNNILFFVAKRNKEVVGRISIGQGEFFGFTENVAFFGHFDVVEDYDVFKYIFDRIFAFLKIRGIKTIIGPITFSTNFLCGLLVSGFDRQPSVLMPYNHKYYAQYFEKYGFTKVVDLFSFEIEKSQLKIPDKIVQFENKVSKKFLVKNITYSYFSENIERITNLFNQSWAQNLLFQKLYPHQTRFLVGSFKDILNPDFCLAVEYENQLVAFSIALPDYSTILKYLHGKVGIFKLYKLYTLMKNVDTIRVAVLGVSPQFRKQGVDILMIMETIRKGLLYGFKKGEISWVLETNKLLLNTLQKFHPLLKSIYRIYQAEI
ncbi:MAG: hypothetical protein ACK4NF_01510 [Planctomycetota bacterium]